MKGRSLLGVILLGAMGSAGAGCGGGGQASTGAGGTGTTTGSGGSSPQGSGEGVTSTSSGTTGTTGSAAATTGSAGTTGSAAATTSSAAATTSSGSAATTGSAAATTSSSSSSGGGACGPTALDEHPLGCKFGWGIADPGGSSYAADSYVQFMSYWVDSTISAAGTFTTCNGCSWLAKLKSTNIIPAYYGYIIGFLGHANGIVDGNQTGTQNLTNAGAALIRAHRQAIVDAYGWYAKQSYQAWPTKPLVWLLEGDFVQYTDTSQVDSGGKVTALSYAELGQLAADITCAIKSNMPNAVVAIDHSTWNSDDVTNSFWGAMKSVKYDLAWTTGVGDNAGFMSEGTTSATYNGKTATYAYLHSLTGKPILVDTSAGASAAGDSWSTTTVANLNARISEGVIAANITGTPPTGLQGNITKLAPSLTALPSCP